MNDQNRPQKDLFSRVVSVGVMVVFLLILLTPLALLCFNGEDQTVMEGEARYTQPGFALGDFLRGDYQKEFESWFSTRYPMRGEIVSTYRKLQYAADDLGFGVSALLPSQTPADSTDTPAETQPVDSYSDSNVLYTAMNKRLFEREAVEKASYRGTEQVVIGKSGYLYENGYINEYYGLSPKYRDCSDEFLEERVQKLAEIQQMLAQRGIAFTLIITPSKASEYARFIPDWYMAQNSLPEEYVRPVTRLLPMLEDQGVHVIDSASYFDEIGLDETFPLTGIHWNKPAAYEATRALMQSYESQSGRKVRNLLAYNLTLSGYKTPGYGNSETDIFGVAYSGLPESLAVKDDFYYWPELMVENPNGGSVDVLIQGGSFCWDFKYYMQTYGLCDNFRQFYYNEWQEDDWTDPRLMGEEAWGPILDSVDYVVMECNEQYVCMMGTEPPRWGAADREPLGDDRWDVYESLHRYLQDTAQ